MFACSAAPHFSGFRLRGKGFAASRKIERRACRNERASREEENGSAHPRTSVSGPFDRRRLPAREVVVRSPPHADGWPGFGAPIKDFARRHLLMVTGRPATGTCDSSTSVSIFFFSSFTTMVPARL